MPDTLDTIQEASTPLLRELGHRRRITDLLVDRAAEAPDHIAFRLRGPDGLTPVTTRQFEMSVKQLAKGLIAQGVQNGDVVAIHGSTGYEWALADFAATWIGAVVVPIFDSASPNQVEHIMVDAEVQWAFADTEENRQTIADAIGKPFHETWHMDEACFRALVEDGIHVTDEELERRRAVPGPDDVATLVYTSGTEGLPKGVVLTHRNLVGQILNVGADYAEIVHDQGSTLIFLPLAHVLARALQLICIAQGMTISYESDPKNAIGALTDVEPTFLVVVPRVLEKITERLGAAADEKKMGWLWRDAEKIGIAWGKHLEDLQAHPQRQPGRALALKHSLYDRLFYRKVRGLLGGRIDYLLSGAAPLSENINLLFRGMGLEVIEGYGLTETTAPLAGNRPGNSYAGTVGPPSPGHTVRISPEGEVLGRGIGVSPGYHRPEHNNDAFVDGFLRTGDLGRLDADGRLTITGRIRDTVVTAGGKTIAPLGWQNTVAENPLVAHAVVVGDSRPYPAALILLDPDEAAYRDILPPSGEAIVVDEEDLIARILPSIRHANLGVSGPERVKRFAVIAVDQSPGSDLVTPTMKLRRLSLIERLAHIVDDLYENGRSV
ncbi:AMP-binding protein [Flaviflexus huanghaiensis]|uniref:AMP-binding protein n=1 Tax=Flaviflexus huanghaiensis TaxID=1111473 RepID=UPI0019D604DE